MDARRAVDRRHVGVPVADRCLDRVERRKLLWRQHESIRTEILFQALDPLRTRNGCDVLALRKGRRKPNLCGRCIGFLCDGLDRVDDG